MSDDTPEITDETTIEARYNDLHEAIQNYLTAVCQVHGTAGLVIDWSLSVEVDHGTALRSFLVFISQGMTQWKALGFASWTWRKLTELGSPAPRS